MTEFHFGPTYRAPQVRCCGKWPGCTIPEPTCTYAKQKREMGIGVYEPCPSTEPHAEHEWVSQRRSHQCAGYSPGNHRTGDHTDPVANGACSRCWVGGDL